MADVDVALSRFKAGRGLPAGDEGKGEGKGVDVDVDVDGSS